MICSTVPYKLFVCIQCYFLAETLGCSWIQKINAKTRLMRCSGKRGHAREAGGGGRGSKERVMRVVGEQVGRGGCCGPVALWPCGPLKGRGGGGGGSTQPKIGYRLGN